MRCQEKVAVAQTRPRERACHRVAAFPGRRLQVLPVVKRGVNHECPANVELQWLSHGNVRDCTFHYLLNGCLDPGPPRQRALQAVQKPHSDADQIHELPWAAWLLHNDAEAVLHAGKLREKLCHLPQLITELYEPRRVNEL